jgi:monofunctional biosynthetic peptidoglycan transglycosylase
VAAVQGTRFLLFTGLLVGMLGAAAITLFRFVDPPMSTLMLAQRLTGTPVRQNWVPLGQISPQLVRAVIASEDSQFCTHRGIDFRELEAALEQAEREGSDLVRGASTITMQVAKNLYLWPSRSYVRKGLELLLAPAIELIWPKSRTLEIYLNIAEWGPGIFGIEAASRHHFRKPASRLTAREAALLATALPSPLERNPGRPGATHRQLAQRIEARMASPALRFGCVLAR